MNIERACGYHMHVIVVALQLARPGSPGSRNETAVQCKIHPVLKLRACARLR